MGARLATAAAIAASLICVSRAAATDITGSIYFNGGFQNNGYDPNSNPDGVPPGYGNETSNTVTVGPGVEFGFQDQYNRDTADFSPTGLVLEDTVLNTGASSWQQTFTANTPGFFNGFTLASSSFSPGISYNVSGDTLTVNWDGEYNTGSADYKATFSGGGGGPEPSTWALMMVGVFGVGAALRRRQNGEVQSEALPA